MLLEHAFAPRKPAATSCAQRTYSRRRLIDQSRPRESATARRLLLLFASFKILAALRNSDGITTSRGDRSRASRAQGGIESPCASPERAERVCVCRRTWLTSCSPTRGEAECSATLICSAVASLTFVAFRCRRTFSGRARGAVVGPHTPRSRADRRRAWREPPLAY
jgi:hypothetical protein